MTRDTDTTPRFAYLDGESRAFALCAQARTLWREGGVRADGAWLTTYEAGEPGRPTVVLVNPLGISCLITTALARRLCEEHHVLTWETRGLPDYRPEAGAGGGDWHPERHCRDLAAILQARGVGADWLVSYCSGANIAIYGLAHGLFTARGLCLASPSLAVEGGRTTDYQRVVVPLLARVARDGLRTAALVRALLQQAGRVPESGEERELSVINDLPFRSDETTHRYAQLHAPCLALDAVPLLRRVTVPTLVVHDRDDDLIHADTVTAIAAALANGTLAWSDGGHFAIHKSRAMQDRILAFLAAQRRTA